jgi:hypothetical protein
MLSGVLMTPDKIEIEFIPHAEQRYDTCGDWTGEWGPKADQKTLRIRVSRLGSPREMFLIAIHELVEALLCEAAGVTEDEVDEWDRGYPERPDYADSPLEPGDHRVAPYNRQHRIATGIEVLLAAEMDVDWTEYERHLNALEWRSPDTAPFDDDIPF